MATLSPLGTIITRVRKAKHMSVKQLVQDASVSRSTFLRVMNGESNPDIANLMRVLNELHLEFDEISHQMPYTAEMYTSQYVAIGQQLIQMVSTGDVKYGQAAIAETRQAFTDHPDEEHQLLHYHALIQFYYLTGDKTTSLKYANLAMDIMRKYDEFSFLDTDMLGNWFAAEHGELLFLAFSRLQAAASTRTNEIDYLFFSEFVLYFTLFEYSFNRGSYVTMMKAIEIMRRRKLSEENMFGMLFNQLSYAIELVLNGHPEDGQRLATPLFDNFEWLHPTNKMHVDWLRSLFASMLVGDWQVEIAAHLNRKESTHDHN